MLRNISLPPGYWVASQSFSAFVTTPMEPVYHKTYQVQQGPAFMVRVVVNNQTQDLLANLHPFLIRTGDPYVLINCTLDNSGCGVLTLPQIGGEFQIGYMDSLTNVMDSPLGKLSVEPGFQPNRVKNLSRERETTDIVFTDIAGHTALLSGVEGNVIDGRMEVIFRTSSKPPKEHFAAVGRVLDGEGRPIGDAMVTIGNGKPEGGSWITNHRARTDETGQFRIAGLSKAEFSGLERQLFAVVRRTGFAGVDTKMRPAENLRGGILDLGDIKLFPGNKVRLRVVDYKGAPLLGAWVEDTGSFASSAEFARTNPDGECIIHNLSTGVHELRVRFGEQYAKATIVAQPGADTEVTLVRLRPVTTQSKERNDDTRPQGPLVVGENMPEWEVVGWTDGSSRKLSDYRGKVLVIEVWGVWCKSCLSILPALKTIQKQFRNQEVVFLGIHTAGTDLDQIRKILKLNECEWPNGLDVGDDDSSGTTVKRFRVRGYPTIIIVGRDGKVAYNTDERSGDRKNELRELQKLANELGIARPNRDNIPEEDGIQIINSRLVHILSQKLEEALTSK
jgi:thiol-disulfide isomerase/thioredoxin